MPWMYLLDGHKPVPCDDVRTWLDGLSATVPRVAFTQHGDVIVSTMFLGINQNISGEEPPVLFETLVLRGAVSGERELYETGDDAVAGHAEMCAKVFPAQPSMEREVTNGEAKSE